MLESNTIGYVSVQEADDYVAQYYVSTDPLRVAWLQLLEADKEAYLRRTFMAIESLPYTGRKSAPTQRYAFPRWPDTSVPEAIKLAQLDNAVCLQDSSLLEDVQHYRTLWQYGVASYRIGNLSETMGSGSWGVGAITSPDLVSLKSIDLLRPYLQGHYQIRGCRR